IEGINYILIPLFFILIFTSILMKRKINISLFLLLMVGMVYGLVLYFYRTSDTGAFFPISFLIYICLICFYVKLHPYDVKNFLYTTNFCYLIYLSLSLACYFLLPSYYRSISLEFFSVRAFHGIEGTPASIDSFSIFVFLINFFYNNSKLKWLVFIVILTVIIFSGTTTPFLILIVVALSYFFLTVIKSPSLLICLFFISMFSVFWLSLNNTEISDLLLLFTSGRNMIWNLQIQNLDWGNLLLGDVAGSTVEIFWGQGETNNPHNAFLFLLLRFGFLITFSLIILLIVNVRNKSKKQQLLILAFLAAGISNSTVMYIGNPFYLYMLGFCLTKERLID
ncbi:hypothetical protein AB6C72_25910, partial [Vibrio splendidus]